MTSNNNIQVLSFEKFYKALQPNITTAKNGILFFNSDNESLDNAAPQKIRDLKLKSGIHSNLIDLKSSLISTPAGLFPVEDSNSALIDFIKSKNRKGESVNTIFKNCAADMALFEQCFIEVIYSKDLKSISEVYHKSVNNIRLEEPDDLGIINNYYYSTTWGLITNKRDRRKVNDIANAVKIPAFNPLTIVESEGRQILHLKKYDGCDNEYPTPGYMSAENWISLIHSISNYVLNKFENGYHIDGFLYMPSNMPTEKQDEFVKDFRNKYQGVDSKNKIVFLFGDTTVQKPEFVPIGDSLGNAVFKEYMLEATKQVCFAHSANLNLLGLSNSDTFGAQGDASNINVSRLQYINDVIIPYQQILLEGFNKIFEFNSLGEATLLNDSLKLTIPKLLDTDTTEDERREMVLGLSPKATTGTTTNNIEVKPVVQ